MVHDAETRARIIAAMPATARMLIECMDFHVAMEVLRTLSCQRVYVPRTTKRLTSDSRLVRLLGSDVAEKLVRLAGGSHIEMPSTIRIERALRNSEIHARFQSGATLNELAAHYRISHRWLRRLRQTMRRDCDLSRAARLARLTGLMDSDVL